MMVKNVVLFETTIFLTGSKKLLMLALQSSFFGKKSGTVQSVGHFMGIIAHPKAIQISNPHQSYQQSNREEGQ